jgi:hypothetical protein
MTNARPFRTSTLQDLSNDTKNIQRRGVLPFAVELKKFGSPGGLQIPNLGSVSFILPLGQNGVATIMKNNYILKLQCFYKIKKLLANMENNLFLLELLLIETNYKN